MLFFYVATAYPPDSNEKTVLAVFETKEEAEECINRFKTRFSYKNGKIELCNLFKEGEYCNE